MKWLGQHIVEFIARFRSDVYLEDLSTTSETNVLVVDSAGKVSKSTSVGSGDITGVDLTGTAPIIIGSETNTTGGAYSSTIALDYGNGLAVVGGELITKDDEIDHDSLDNFVANEHIDWTGASAGTIHASNYTDTTTNTQLSQEQVEDFAGAMIATGGTKTGIAVTYQDGTGDMDFVIGTLNQDTTGTAATVTGAAQTNITSVGTLTALTVDNITIDGSTITASADLALVATGNDITIDTDNIVIESAAESEPVLTLKATHTTINKSGELQFLKDAADTEDNERLGLISFYGEDEGNNNTKFAHIQGKIAESDEGAEGGKLELAIASHDAGMAAGLTLVDGSDNDEVDVTIANGAASVTTVAGTLTMGSTAAMTNAGLLAVANQSSVTGLGTISSGVWNGTAVASAYLDADTAHLSGAQTFTGTKTLNSFKGTSATTVTNILDEDAMGSNSATALATQQSIRAYADTKARLAGETTIATVGTVTSGVWNATKILSPKTTHIIHYPFKGYAAGASTNLAFLFPEDFADPQSPFQLNQNYGDTVIADGSLPDVSNWFRSSGTVMVRDVSAIRMYGWATCGGSDDITISLCKITPTRNNSGAVVPIVIATTTFAAIDNDKMEFFNVTGSDAGTGTGSIVTAAISQGDILMPFAAVPNSKTLFFNLTLEVEG